MQVGEHFGQTTGPPHHKRRRITIATSKAVDASWQKFQPKNGPIAPQEKNKNNRNEQACLCKLANISAKQRVHRTMREEEEPSQRAMLLMQVGQHFGNKNGHIAPQVSKKTIATSKAVDASVPAFRPNNGPTAPHDKNINNRNEQGC
jgi:hypothetical protein